MAEKSGRNKSIDELTAEIAQSRERVTRDLRGLRYEVDFAAKFRRSFREQTISWLTTQPLSARWSHWHRCGRKRFMSMRRTTENQRRSLSKPASPWRYLKSLQGWPDR